ncbi:ATPase, F1/V1/A1 complex, alpha/beta subunit, Zinc knuckle CX2CX4HX4C [Artemisia annua]|uniref:ATPase, F1/V1/A1 complex, alpha/beta subunit, Zinc knuckle CX2CX4HX4C n=1 Tax=Artemisia annua TaxID=35608 RepID=A0A2U1KQU6_ARTAN|nr:ATPase, F1/V1/A1 complex, alpha/beta subunit, Zinc knuckle CX2CX4HX4C [Artemisia annua]
MSKRNTSNKRKTRAYVWLNDHVVGTSSQNRKEKVDVSIGKGNSKKNLDTNVAVESTVTGKKSGDKMNGVQTTVNEVEVNKNGSEPKEVMDDETNNSLRYNIRRMWSKFGITDISASKNGQYLFKFRDIEGLNNVIDKGPWMVQNKHLFIQKWSPEMGMQKIEPKKVPVWVKMSNVPLEAWSLKGISALASSLGKPMVMDNMTAAMCYKGVGNLDYARVLVEIDAEKEIKHEIEVQYRDMENKVKGTKKISVVYDWKPTRCAECKVFGHATSRCMFNKSKEDGLEKETGKDTMEKNGNEKVSNKGKEKVQDQVQKSSDEQHKQNVTNRNFNYPNNKQQEYRRKQFNGEKKNNGNAGTSGVKKVWNLKEKEAEELRKTANKYSVLSSLPDDDDQELRILKDRIIVDQYLNKNLQPTPSEAANWSQDMRMYYKEKSAKVIDVDDNGSEDVISETAADVWNKAKKIADTKNVDGDWNRLIMNFTTECVNKNIGWVVRRLVLAACVYFLWQERNGRIFRDVHNSSQEIYNKVVENVKGRLSGIIVKDSINTRSVEEKWQYPAWCFSDIEVGLEALHTIDLV